VGDDVPSGYSQKGLHFPIYTVFFEFALIFPGELGFSWDHVEKVFSKSCRDEHIQELEESHSIPEWRYVPEFIDQIYEKSLQ
jgi:hypothetical protein